MEVKIIKLEEEKLVEEAMKNIKVKIKKDGKWIDEQDL